MAPHTPDSSLTILLDEPLLGLEVLGWEVKVQQGRSDDDGLSIGSEGNRVIVTKDTELAEAVLAKGAQGRRTQSERSKAR